MARLLRSFFGVQYSLLSITLFLLHLLLPLFLVIFCLRRVLPLPTVSPHSFSPLHLYGCYYHLLASTQFIKTLHSVFPLEIYFIIIFTPVLSAVVPRWAPVSFFITYTKNNLALLTAMCRSNCYASRWNDGKYRKIRLNSFESYIREFSFNKFLFLNIMSLYKLWIFENALTIILK